MATLLWAFLFGSIGLGYFVYGKRQSAPTPLLCGLLLMLFPYFVDDTWLLVVIGAALTAAPYLLRR